MNQWTTIPSDGVIQKTVDALKKHNISPLIVASGKEAMEQIISLIPKGASIMNGSSKTLEQIGYLDYLKGGKHGWNDLHHAITSENDPEKRAELRRQSVLSDYYLGSVHALSGTGEFLIASNTGSQLPHVVYTSPNLIFVVGAQKIVPTLADAFKRLEEYVYPLENKHMMDLYKVGTNLSKIVVFKKERQKSGRTVRMIIVKEVLGF
ncbi:MAG: lactate utilization protein [bacterium]|nr:lactate utilization protein [bacterium]